MNNMVGRVARDERGAAMALTVILLLVAGLVVASLLSFMGTGLSTGRVYEGRVAELYGADAGIEDAVWKIQQQVPEIYELYCGAGNHTWSYNISSVNNREVNVVVAYVDPFTYLVKATATGDGSGTQVEAYVAGVTVADDYSGILNGILTSQAGLGVKDQVTLNYSEGHEPAANYTGAWPDEPEEVERFAQFYWMDVKYGTELISGTVDLAGFGMSLGPAYRKGELVIENSSNTPATLTLTGTLYITGDTLIGATEKEFILDLNGHTIFVESSSADPEKALWMGGKCTLKGPGCIIAIGDVYFEPNPDVGSVGEPVFVFSVLGATTIRPGVNMYGAVAGSVQVGVQSGSKPEINYPVGGFGGLINFPGLVQTKLLYGIASWQVTPLSPQELNEP